MDNASNFNDLKKRFVLDSSKTIPQGIAELPSNGAKVTFSPMKVKQQKEFLKALEKKDETLINEAFDHILNACVSMVDDKPFDVDSLCVQDRTFLLIRIRQLTSGPEVKITHICPKSEVVYNNIPIDLNTLQIEPYKGTSITQELDLTPSIKVILGLVTRKDEKDIERWIKNKSKDNSVIDRRYCVYASIIKNIKMKKEVKENEQAIYEDIPVTFDQKVEFITDACAQKDLALFDEYIKTLDFGIRLRFHFKSDAGYENENEEANIISFFIM